MGSREPQFSLVNQNPEWAILMVQHYKTALSSKHWIKQGQLVKMHRWGVVFQTPWSLALLAFRHLFIAALALDGKIWFYQVNISCSPGILWNNGVGFKMISHPRMLSVDCSLSPFSNRILSTYVHPYPLLLSTHNISNRQMSWTFYSFPAQHSLWVSIKKDIWLMFAKLWCIHH